MNQYQQFDASIPVLTEVLSDIINDTASETLSEPLARQGELAAQPVAEVIPVTNYSNNHWQTTAAPAPAAPQWDEHQWQALEQRLAERVLTQLQDRVNFTLEQNIRDSMADVLQRAVAELTGEIRQGLQHTIEHLVLEAVGQELAQLKTEQAAQQ